ncbi:DUF1007 family protein [Ectothiorhodospira lacustris]|uniref:DUF1007 family protein n=1 Tax=Ectothiorhodospira lacustris TaxID=2899127 RepID=UPI001EE7E04C|nr:DUF1007 family protein [Ectothiorhodospira lacustris]MCG5509862.1 DUF1007 family protein [Ectothiorhodospira lacustris]MCG5521115.1 DUF1007 family protein [Ectothiorhodospira lacustris]
MPHPGLQRPLRTLCCLLLTLSAVTFSPAGAHPHAWIDLEVTAVFDDTGHVTGLRQTWLMDPFYSVFLLDEMAHNATGDTREEKLADIARQVIENLTEYHFFTEIHHGEQLIRDVRAEAPTLKEINGRLALSFTLHFQTHVDPARASLRYAVFDPTYFIEILHAENTVPHLEGGTERCEIRIHQPRPDPVLVARAMALDYDQTGDPDLGKHFAERAEIRCSD